MNAVPNAKSLKFIADVNVEKTIVEFLASAGYEVKWIPDYDCGMDDSSLLELAKNEGRILITNDKDFGEIFFLQKRVAAGIILLRAPELNGMRKVLLVGKLISGYGDKISGRFVVVTRKKFRLFPMEDVK